MRMLLLVWLLITACANMRAIEDFGEGTSKFSSSYNTVYPGSFDTCVTTEELKSTINEISGLEKVDTIKQIEAAKQI